MNILSAKYHYSKERITREEEVIKQAKYDPCKFDTIYNNYHEQIFMYVLKRVESEDTAADVTSQVFLKALTNLHRYKDMGFPFASWLYRIARNEVYNLYHQNKI